MKNMNGAIVGVGVFAVVFVLSVLFFGAAYDTVTGGEPL